MFSEEELIALISSSTTGSPQVSSSIYPPYVDKFSLPKLTRTGEISFTLKGLGFTPDCQVEIRPYNTSTNIVTYSKVVSFSTINVTINVPNFGLHEIEVFNLQGRSSLWEPTLINIIQQAQVGWLDFRNGVNIPVVTNFNNGVNQDFSSSNLTTTSNSGLSRNSTTHSNFIAYFPSLEILPGDINIEFISYFHSGNFRIFLGLITNNIDWTQEIFKQDTYMAAFENRAWLKTTGGRDIPLKDAYFEKLLRQTNNWVGAFQHTIIKRISSGFEVTFYASETLSYNWDDPYSRTYNGRLSEKSGEAGALSNSCYPCFFMEASSLSTLIAMKIS